MPARLLKSQSIDYTTRNSEGQQLDMVVDEKEFVCVCVYAVLVLKIHIFFRSDRDILFLRRLLVLSDKTKGLLNSIRNWWTRSLCPSLHVCCSSWKWTDAVSFCQCAGSTSHRLLALRVLQNRRKTHTEEYHWQVALLFKIFQVAFLCRSQLGEACQHCLLL